MSILFLDEFSIAYNYLRFSFICIIVICLTISGISLCCGLFKGTVVNYNT